MTSQVAHSQRRKCLDMAGVLNGCCADSCRGDDQAKQWGLIEEATAEVRTHRSTPLFKLYVIDDAEAFFGFYRCESTR